MTKIYSNIFDEITNFKNIIESHRKAITGSKKFKKEAVIFSLYEDKNLVDLWKELKNMKYTPSDYIEFEVFEPKRRTIHAPRGFPVMRRRCAGRPRGCGCPRGKPRSSPAAQA